MTLHDVKRIHNRWERFPPLPVLVLAIAKALGIEFDFAASKPKPMTEAEFNAFLNATGGKIPGVGSM